MENRNTLSLKDKDKPETDQAEAKPELVNIVLDLAPGAGGAIIHNGIAYMNRVSYKVTQGVANDLLEIQNRGLAHEASLHESENKTRRTNRAFV